MSGNITLQEARSAAQQALDLLSPSDEKNGARLSKTLQKVVLSLEKANQFLESNQVHLPSNIQEAIQHVSHATKELNNKTVTVEELRNIANTLHAALQKLDTPLHHKHVNVFGVQYGPNVTKTQDSDLTGLSQ